MRRPANNISMTAIAAENVLWPLGKEKLLSSVGRGQSSGRSRTNQTFTISMFKVGTNAANPQNSASRFYRQNTGRRQPRRSRRYGDRGFAQIMQHGGNRVKTMFLRGMDGVHQRRFKAKPPYCASQMPMMRVDGKKQQRGKVGARLDWAGDKCIIPPFLSKSHQSPAILQRIFPRRISKRQASPSSLL